MSIDQSVIFFFPFNPHDNIWTQQFYLLHEIMGDDWKTAWQLYSKETKSHLINGI